MSERVPVWTWRDAIRVAQVPPLTKHVCNMIANYVSDVGSGCYPSIKTLQSDTGLSNTSLANHLATAVKEGLLEIRRHRGKDGRLGGNHYFPRFPNNVDLPRSSSGSSGICQDDEIVSQEPGGPREAPSLGPREAHGKNHVKQPREAPSLQVTIQENYPMNSPARERASEFENCLEEGEAEPGSAAKPGTPLPSKRKPKSRTNAMDCAISKEARAEARKLAAGWDLRELETEWREWNAAQNNVVRDPDQAFLAFCRKRGPHKSARKLKLSAPVPAEYRKHVLVAGTGETIIDRLGAHWQPWLDHLHAVAPELAKQARKTFAMAVPALRPFPGCALPRVQAMPVAKGQAAA